MQNILIFTRNSERKHLFGIKRFAMYISKYFEQVYICCCGIEFEGTVFDSEEPCKRHKGNHGKKCSLNKRYLAIKLNGVAGPLRVHPPHCTMESFFDRWQLFFTPQ